MPSSHSRNKGKKTFATKPYSPSPPVITPKLTRFSVSLSSLRKNSFVIRSTLPAKLVPALRTLHVVAPIALLYPPPADGIRTPLTDLLHSALTLLLRSLAFAKGGRARVALRVVLCAREPFVERDGGMIEAVRVSAGHAHEGGIGGGRGVQLARWAIGPLAPIEIGDLGEGRSCGELVEAVLPYEQGQLRAFTSNLRKRRFCLPRIISVW